jgi:branched-chain amino acid transport system permease protein
MFSYLLVSGVTTGALYGLVALGIVIVYKATRAVNFAHGDLFMFGGFTAYTLHVMWGVWYVPTLLTTVVLAFLLGMLVERVAFRPLMERSLVSVLLATIGLSFILKGAARYIWGGKGDYLPFPRLVDSPPIIMGDVIVEVQQLVVLGGAVGIMLLLAIFFKATRIGKMMQATADNAKAAKLVGVRTGQIYMFTFAIGAAVAAAAAGLMAPLTLLYPDLGFILFIKSFAAAVLGGLTSVTGAIVGGLIMGIVEVMAGGYISTQLQDVSAFIVIMAVLIFMPSGLFGQDVRRV